MLGFRLLLIFSFVVISSGCISSEYNVGTRRQDLMLYSTEKEVTIGQNIARKVAEEYEISNNPDDIERINKIGERIVEVCDRKGITYYFYVIDKDEKNAFALPGGYIYIFKGLFDLLEDDELAFVLAHEVGHVVSRHSMKKLQAAMGYNLLLIASVGTTGDPQFTRGLSTALAFIFMEYSKEDEFNADELAVKYCGLAGFDPKAGIEVMEKLYEKSRKSVRPFSYFRTHPYTSQRITHIKETLRIPLDIEDYMNL